MRQVFASVVAAACLANASQAEVPQVVTDILPIHSIVAQVMGDLGSPTVLLEGSADPHHFQLRPSQVRALSRADLVFWVGPDLTPWLDRALDSSASATAVSMLGEPDLPTKLTAITDHHAGHGHDDDHADEHDEEHQPLDAHAWLDPLNAAHFALTVGEALAAADPTNAATYTSNAEASAARLRAIPSKYDFGAVEGAVMLPYHDAFQYAFVRFGLNYEGALANVDGLAPSAGEMSELRDLVETSEKVCVFTEPGADTRLLDLIAPDLSYAVLDPRGGSIAPGPELYETLMQDIAEKIVTCLDP